MFISAFFVLGNTGYYIFSTLKSLQIKQSEKDNKYSIVELLVTDEFTHL